MPAAVSFSCPAPRRRRPSRRRISAVTCARRDCGRRSQASRRPTALAGDFAYLRARRVAWDDVLYETGDAALWTMVQLRHDRPLRPFDPEAPAQIGLARAGAAGCANARLPTLRDRCSGRPGPRDGGVPAPSSPSRRRPACWPTAWSLPAVYDRAGAGPAAGRVPAHRGRALSECRGARRSRSRSATSSRRRWRACPRRRCTLRR